MQKIITFFEYVYEFLKFLVTGIIKVGKLLFSLVMFVVDAFAALPTSIKIVLIVIVAISVIYKIISLGGSGE